MELKYPEKRCEDSPNRAHYYRQLVGNIWRCHYCWAAKWLPNNFIDASKFSNDIGRLGRDRAYEKLLSQRPKIRQMLAKLEEIRMLKKVMPQKDLMVAMAAIIADKGGEPCGK